MVVLGRDPRVSGEFISSAVAAGLASSGVDVFDAGVLPTPATAFLIADSHADFGVMISASHNPAPDNGIKIFARGGVKLDDAIEDQIEAELDGPFLTPTGSAVGRITRFADAEDRYIVHLLKALPNPLTGLRLVLDCAPPSLRTASLDLLTNGRLRPASAPFDDCTDPGLPARLAAGGWSHDVARFDTAQGARLAAAPPPGLREEARFADGVVFAVIRTER